jgi:hypothetical protein
MRRLLAPWAVGRSRCACPAIPHSDFLACPSRKRLGNYGIAYNSFANRLPLVLQYMRGNISTSLHGVLATIRTSITYCTYANALAILGCWSVYSPSGIPTTVVSMFTHSCCYPIAPHLAVCSCAVIRHGRIIRTKFSVPTLLRAGCHHCSIVANSLTQPCYLAYRAMNPASTHLRHRTKYAAVLISQVPNHANVPLQHFLCHQSMGPLGVSSKPCRCPATH